MAAATVRYQPNKAGLGQFMRGKEMQAFLRGRAQQGKAFAEAAAPRRTGEYARSFRVAVTAHGGAKRDRAAAYLYNDSDHALAVEFQDGYRILGRAVDVIKRG